MASGKVIKSVVNEIKTVTNANPDFFEFVSALPQDVHVMNGNMFGSVVMKCIADTTEARPTLLLLPMRRLTNSMGIGLKVSGAAQWWDRGTVTPFRVYYPMDGGIVAYESFTAGDLIVIPLSFAVAI